MKLHKRYESIDEAIDAILYRPLEAYLHIRINGGLLDDMNEQYDLIKFILRDISEDLIYLGVCIVCVFVHMVRMLFYPAVKVFELVKLRRIIMRNEDQFREYARLMMKDSSI